MKLIFKTLSIFYTNLSANLPHWTWTNEFYQDPIFLLPPLRNHWGGGSYTISFISNDKWLIKQSLFNKRWNFTTSWKKIFVKQSYIEGYFVWFNLWSEFSIFIIQYLKKIYSILKLLSLFRKKQCCCLDVSLWKLWKLWNVS